ncbi:MAG: hypothetical protein LBH74_07885 [Nitrososphaerota archaeon]|nr:hypothetical protein [Nitrososphaerota archaeon]
MCPKTKSRPKTPKIRKCGQSGDCTSNNNRKCVYGGACPLFAGLFADKPP